jgi:hypothetical protein
VEREAFMAELVATPYPDPGSNLRGAFSPWRGAAWLFGALAWVAAALVGAVLALVLTATVVVIAAMSSLLLSLASASVRARRAVHAQGPGPLIEARRVGGHSWVAYGWDGDV